MVKRGFRLKSWHMCHFFSLKVLIIQKLFVSLRCKPRSRAAPQQLSHNSLHSACTDIALKNWHMCHKFIV